MAKIIPITNAPAAGSETGCEDAEPFALQVLGDSMLPEFAEGEIIIVEPAGRLADGCFVIAMHNGEHIFRQLAIHNGRWYLRPLNDLYPTVEISGIDAIKGIITQKRHPRRRKLWKSYL